MNRRRWLRGSTWSLTIVLVVSGLVAVAPARATNSHVSGTHEFDEPSGLAIASGHLWVTNEAGNSVTEINPSTGAWLASFLRTGGYGFNQPDAITRSGANLFIANASGSVTEMSSRTGTLIRTISGATFHFAHPVAITSWGPTVFVLNAGGSRAPGSITELNSRTGALVRRVSGTRFAFSDPAAFTVSGRALFVADKGGDAVTEIDEANGSLIRVVRGRGLQAPDGIAVSNGRVWVADSASNAATDINASTGVVIATYSDADGSYGFGEPSTVIAARGNVYVMTPFGSSPMVTKVSATAGTPYWYMCNTNGPYYFSLLSAFAVSGNDLWVASRSGANSQTAGAATGSLTEMLMTTGALITTLPNPSSTAPTTTTVPTTTTTTTATL
jgi:outer membrane protein assembly factor BamB